MSCECGCGDPTPIATYTKARYGIRRGQPLRFIPGHQNRTSPVDYIEEDRGHDTPCWIWQMGTNEHGYGTVNRGGRQQQAHRFYFKQAGGTLPDDIDLHHRCEVRPCVNPAHLEPLTTAAHLRRHSSLTADDVRTIRERFAPRRVTRQMLADEFGISVSTVKKILRWDTWRDEPQEATA